MSGVRGAGFGRQGFNSRGCAGNVGDRGRGVSQHGQPLPESCRIDWPGSRWPRSQSARRGQGQTHEDLRDSASERGEAQTRTLHPDPTLSNLPPEINLDEIFRRDQFGQHLDFLSSQGNDSTDHLKTLCGTLANQLLTCKLRLAQSEPASPLISFPPTLDRTHSVRTTHGYLNPGARPVLAGNQQHLPPKKRDPTARCPSTGATSASCIFEHCV